MTEVMRTQILEIGMMFSCGITIAGLRWLISIHQKTDSPGKGISFVQDMLFWCLAGLLTTAYLYDCSFGAWSVHGAFSLAAGYGVGYGIANGFRKKRGT